MSEVEDIAEIAIEIADEKGFPIVLLGGDPDDPMAEMLRMAGVQFLHARDLACTPRAVYITQEQRYDAYRFGIGSVVIDKFNTIPDQPGVTVHRKPELVDE
ncbi:hypothetical protein SEA_EJIMIX_23 [Mycobacterium phage Ejimix]|uniref:UDP-glucose dehydrogenase n=1 Tax=Mycobacterium phage Thibault TaxID=1052673 RepID=G1FG83_9CAUD|nr:hypothetical protein N860_gp021 [Mycobacterium phage Redno2]YP_008410411.1 hypothetical protein N857_gp022 [Mycobacterium phage Wanda]YP_009018029.1 hypothetical protein CL87_gp018 [Mycobacterium phage Thibault]ATN89738.1 glycosyltransferase [Mycobacterium phage Klein]AXQ52027.1 hypothetical protein SEA_EJIMIX_23 [Mycobacterium phage Ejimix]AXQ62429.1 hypothetical protein SEA_ZELINK_22 [Mycobacterium phage Zelink]QBI97469.1 hypothetical protein SEA_HUGHESYANG_21 [Mycobacterium phage Hughes